MQRTALTHGWRLKQADPRNPQPALDDVPAGEDSGWLDIAEMPAMVHTVLADHDIIEPPWLPGRAEACRWVAEQDWVYATSFTINDTAGEHTLHFEGLDAIADVTLNGQHIAQHSNVYMPLSVDVSEVIRRENDLRIHIHSVFDPTTGDRQKLTCVDGDPDRPVRRSRSNYSTYLGPHPYFSRTGVFRPVWLESVGIGGITETSVDAALSQDHQQGTVSVHLEGQVNAEASLRLRLVAPDGRQCAASTTTVAGSDAGFDTTVQLTIDRPALWWPRGYGEQPLYQLTTDLIVNDDVLDTTVRTVGFRRVDMPETLHFEVNGLPVRLWGACWVSPDWVTAVWDQDRAEKLIDLAENANFNAFRVWGEVESPPDAFYEMADRHGFLVWQDFADLPLEPDARSRAICRTEAAHTVRRLKHHPSVLMWCGGNEAAQWQTQEYGGPGGPWRGRQAAEEDVGDICRQLDPARVYLPNSPYHGIDPNDPREGDTHGYTNIWVVPGYDYLNFASEDTRIAAPPLRSMERLMAAEDLWPVGTRSGYTYGCQYPWPESWMEYTTSQSWRKTGPVEQLYDPRNPAEAVYRLGMAASIYYQDTIERQRRGRPATEVSDRRICGGYLAWKFNDSWPQIYSGKVDYFLEPYIPYYAIRRAYAPILLSLEMGTCNWLWAVNDSPNPVTGTVTLVLFHPHTNTVVHEANLDVTVGPGRSAVIAQLDDVGIGTFHRDHVLAATLRDAQGQILARTLRMADIERNLVFPEAKLTVQSRDGELLITTDQFARAIVIEGKTIDGDTFGWFFEDNWFDLLPGEQKVVKVLGEHAEGSITAKAWYSPHSTTIKWSQQ